MKNIIYMYSGLDRSNKLLIIIILVIIALLIIIGLYNLVSNIIYKIRVKKNYKASIDNKINEEFKKQEEKKEDVVVPTVSREETKEESIENYQRAVKEEMEEIETLDESVSDIDEILIEMMNMGSQEDFDLTDFEREQEENAIISYGELCKKAGVQKIVYPKKEINKEVEKKIEKEVYNGNFKPTTVISPIYGVQKEEKKDEESENEFLGRLKEFRSGL